MFNMNITFIFIAAFLFFKLLYEIQVASMEVLFQNYHISLLPKGKRKHQMVNRHIPDFNFRF